MGKFANKPSHKASKRQGTSKKNKIDKKVKEHNKKMKKEAKRLKTMGIIKKKSTQHIELPNTFPFKKDVLDQLEMKKKQRELEKLQKQLGGKKPEEEIEVEEVANKKMVFEEVELKKVNDELKEQREGFHLKDAITLIKESKKYYKEVKKVIEASDVVLEILDARDPQSCRCKRLEIIKSNKKIILVLTKTDLVPESNSNAWKSELEKEYTTVLLRQEKEGLPDAATNSNAINAEQLIEQIKGYFQDSSKTNIIIGVIGYPNVGKISVLRALKKTKAVTEPQSTGIQVKLVDSPGVILDEKANKSVDILRNQLKPDQIEDPVAPVAELLKKIPKDDILIFYKIADYNNITEFLKNLAKVKGLIKKGAIPNLEQAARSVITDWNSGKLKYVTNL